MVPTHLKGHILDLILTCCVENFVLETYAYETNMSDHFWIHDTFQFEKPKPVKKLIKYRKIKDIDVNALKL